MRFKLYHTPATRSVRVRWLLLELLGPVGFEEERVSLYDGDQYEPAFVGKNPNHAVPVLQITDSNGHSRNMLESGAMVAWLADCFPERGLAPPARELSFERADYLQMLHFGCTSVDSILWQIRCHEHLLPAEERDPRTSLRYRHKFLNEIEPQLLGRLRRTAFICGDSFRAADCVIAHDVRWARAYGLCSDSVFEAYISQVARRPAYQLAYGDVVAGTSPAIPDHKRARVKQFSG